MTPEQLVPSGDTVSQIATLIILLGWVARGLKGLITKISTFLTQIQPILEEVPNTLKQIQEEVAAGRADARQALKAMQGLEEATQAQISRLSMRVAALEEGR